MTYTGPTDVVEVLVYLKSTQCLQCPGETQRRLAGKSKRES